MAKQDFLNYGSAEQKNIEMFTKTIEDRTVTGIASVFGVVDSYADIVHPGAFKKTIKEGFKRIRHLWMHDFWEPPTAIIKELKEIKADELPDEVRQKWPEAKGGLLVVRDYLRTPRGDEILEGIKGGAINEMSFGYDPKKYDFEELQEGDGKGMLVRNLREVALWDISDVNWGANPATAASKAAVPYKDTGKAPEDESWSAPSMMDFTDEMWEELSDAEKRRIAAHFGWAASMPPEMYGDLKLPHHRAEKSGVGPAVWKGVAAAMGALLGARGGVDIPEGDRRGVYNHLAKHYEQFDKEAPDFKYFVLAASVREVLALDAGTAKSGRVLSSANLEKLKDALAMLEEILQAAEPPEDDEKTRALTDQVWTRLAIAERESTTFERLHV